MNNGIRHFHFQNTGFEGDNVSGYEKGPIEISIYEDDDCLDKFSAKVDGVDKGWIRDTDALNELLTENGFQELTNSEKLGKGRRRPVGV